MVDNLQLQPPGLPSHDRVYVKLPIRINLQLVQSLNCDFLQGLFVWYGFSIFSVSEGIWHVLHVRETHACLCLSPLFALFPTQWLARSCSLFWYLAQNYYPWYLVCLLIFHPSLLLYWFGGKCLSSIIWLWLPGFGMPSLTQSFSVFYFGSSSLNFQELQILLFFFIVVCLFVWNRGQPVFALAILLSQSPEHWDNSGHHHAHSFMSLMSWISLKMKTIF